MSKYILLQELETKVDRFIKGKQKALLILGSAGMGKSMLCQRIFEKYSLEKDFIIIPIPLCQVNLQQNNFDTLIEQALHKMGFTSESVRKKSLLFIFDGVDRLNCYTNFYMYCHLAKWNAKVIFTCRPEFFVNSNNYSVYFTPVQGDRKLSHLFAEISMPLFTKEQIAEYLQGQWQNDEKYQNCFSQLPFLSELVQIPLWLNIIAEKLPKIRDHSHSETLDFAVVLKELMNSWFHYHEAQLKEEGFWNKDDKTLKQKFGDYCAALAREYKKENVTEIMYKGPTVLVKSNQNKWSHFFSVDKEMAIQRSACPLQKRKDGAYTFIHPVLLDYFASDAIPQQQTTISPSDNKPKNEIIEAKSPPSTKIARSPLFNHGLNQKSLTDNDEGMIEFFAGLVRNNKNIERMMFEFISLSKEHEEIEIGSSNAIRILVRAGVCLSGLNFNNIKASKTNLSGGIFSYTSFKGAYLKEVNMQRIWLENADLSLANVHNAKWGEMPYFLLPLDTHEHYSYHGQLLTVAIHTENKYSKQEKDSLVIYQTMEEKELLHLKDLHIFRDLNSKIAESIAMSPKGHILALLTKEGNVELWNFFEKKLIRVLSLNIERHASGKIFLSDDGKKLAVTEFKNVSIWEIDPGKLLYQYTWPEGTFVTSFNSNLSLLATVAKQSTSIWDAYNGKFLATLDEVELKEEYEVEQNMNPNEATLSSGSAKQLVIFSPNNKYIARSDGDRVRVWLVKEKMGYPEVKLNDGSRCECISFSSNDLYLAVGFEKVITLWLIENSKLVYLFDGHADKITSLSFSLNDERLISTSKDNTGRILSINPSETAPFVKNPNLNKKEVNEVKLSPIGHILAVASGGEFSLWAVDQWRCVFSEKVDQQKIVSMAFSPNGHYFAVLGKITSTATLFDISDFPKVKQIQRKYKGDFHLRDTRSKGMMTASEMRYEKSSKGISFRTLQYFNYEYSGVRLSHANKKKVLDYWMDYIYQHYGHVNLYLGYTVTSLALNDKYLAIGNDDDSYHIWNLEDESSRYVCSSPHHMGFSCPTYVESDRQFHNFLNHIHQIKRGIVAASSPTGLVLATTINNVVKLTGWDTKEWIGSIPVELSTDVNKKVDVEIGANLDYMLVTQGDSVVLWPMPFSLKYTLFPGRREKITCASLSPDSQYVALGSINGIVYLWEIKSRQTVATAHASTGKLHNISWAQNSSGLFFVTASADDVVRYWRVIKTDSEVLIMLYWTNNQFSLVANNANITSTLGLSVENRNLLKQRGAIEGKSRPKKIDFLEKEMTSDELVISVLDREKSPLQEYGFFSTQKRFTAKKPSERDDEMIHAIKNLCPEALEIFKSGDAALTRYELDKAIQYFLQATKIDPGMSVFYERLAYCSWLLALQSEVNEIFALVKFQQIEDAINKALDLEANVNIFILCASYLVQQQQFEKAFSYLEKIINTECFKLTDKVLIFEEFNQILLPEQIWAEVEEFKTLKVQATTLAYYLLILVCKSLKKNEDGARYLKEFNTWVSNVDKHNAFSYSLLGYCCQLLNLNDQAYTYFTYAIEINPDYKVAKDNIKKYEKSLEKESEEDYVESSDFDEELELAKALSISEVDFLSPGKNFSP